MPYKIGFAGIKSTLSNYRKAKFIILPIPVDITSEWKHGSNLAPELIIEASDFLEFYDIELERDISQAGIFTANPISPISKNLKQSINLIYSRSKHYIKDGKFIIGIGGEHTITLGIVKAYLSFYKNLTVLQLDAHADLRNRYLKKYYSQATIMRRISELCNIVQVGIRSISKEEHDYVKQNNIPLFSMEYIGKNSFELLLNQIINILSENVYLTIDMDVFDPAFVPSVGTPEPEGMNWRQVIHLIKEISVQRKIIGADIVELCPVKNEHASIYTAAKLIYKIIGYASLNLI